jgi:hypothetical protein
MGFVSVMIDSYERGRDVRHRRPGRRDVGGFTDAARADHGTIAPTDLGGLGQRIVSGRLFGAICPHVCGPGAIPLSGRLTCRF